MIRTGDISPDPAAVPDPFRVGVFNDERQVFLNVEAERQAAIKAQRDQPKSLRIPLGYEGPGTASLLHDA